MPPALLTVKEIFGLFRHISHARDALMIRVLYATGMRQAELVRFCPADLDFVRGTVFVRPPGVSADRYLPLDDLTLELLRHWIAGQPPDRPVFPLVPRHVYTRLRLWTDSLGLTAKYLAQGQRVSPHSLRLSALEHCAARGMSAEALRLLQGGEVEPCGEWRAELGEEVRYAPGRLPVLVTKVSGPVEEFLFHSGVRWEEVAVASLEPGLVRLPDRAVPVPAGLTLPVAFEGSSPRHEAVGRRYLPSAFRHLRAVLWLEEGRSLAEVGRLLGHGETATTRRYLRCAVGRWRAEYLACHPLGAAAL